MQVLNLSERIDELNTLLKRSYYKEKYKYLFSNGYFEPINTNVTNWSGDGFIFIDDDKIIGCLEFNISRPNNSLNIHSLCLFTDLFKHKKFIYNNIIEYIEKTLQNKYFSKITFSVVVGNHIENAYDKFINKFNGRIVGIKEKECLLSDGNFYDLKMYEIINNNYKF